MFQRFDEECKKVLKKAKLEMQELKHPFVGSEHLILSILSFQNLKITEKLNEYNVTYSVFKEELINTIGIGNSLNSYFIYTPMLKRVIENAILDTKENNLLEVNVNSLFLALLEEGEGVAIRILSNLGVDINELYLEFENKEIGNSKYKSKKKLSIYDHSINLVEKAKEGKIDPVIGRDKEINRLIEILLRRNKNNPLLIGEAGVGKTAIVEGLALKIANREVPESLLDKKILSVSMASLVAGTKYRGEFEDRISKIIKEIESNPNLIVFIDEMHSLVGAGGAEGAIDASNIFKPALARGKFKLIGATTIKEYKDSIEKDKALNRRFQTILIEEPNYEATCDILFKIKPLYEKFHQVVVPDAIIKDIVGLANKYIFNRKNPDKAIDILDEVCASCSLKKDKNFEKLEQLKKDYQKMNQEKNDYIIKHDFLNAFKIKETEIVIEDKINKLYLKNSQRPKKVVTKEDIARIIKAKSNIPVYEIDKESARSLKNLEANLKDKIFGQDEAINIICQETKKIKLGLKQKNSPISFLFTGKSGIGKTELAKQYASILKMPLIRIDASEYRESHAISKIIGSPPGYVGYESSNTILDDIKNNPYSVILIDEIEKASTSFLNLFLQIFEEGFITNSSLEKIYFNHAIIIMTSNITASVNAIGFTSEKEKFIKNKLENALSFEFVNRIDHIIQFNELNEETIKQIIKQELLGAKKKFKEQGIKLTISDQVIEEIFAKSNHEKNGARYIKKLLENKLDSIVIDSLLNGNEKVHVKTLS